MKRTPMLPRNPASPSRGPRTFGLRVSTLDSGLNGIGVPAAKSRAIRVPSASGPGSQATRGWPALRWTDGRCPPDRGVPAPSLAARTRRHFRARMRFPPCHRGPRPESPRVQPAHKGAAWLREQEQCPRHREIVVDLHGDGQRMRAVEGHEDCRLRPVSDSAVLLGVDGVRTLPADRLSYPSLVLEDAEVSPAWEQTFTTEAYICERGQAKGNEIGGHRAGDRARVSAPHLALCVIQSSTDSEDMSVRMPHVHLDFPSSIRSAHGRATRRCRFRRL